MDGLELRQESSVQLEQYSSIPIGYEIRGRIDLHELIRTGDLVERPIAARWKDYDAHPEERPTTHRSSHDLSNWLILAAYEGDRRIGGLMVARDTPTFEMLEGRRDLAVLVDLRVAPDARGKGIGRELLRRAVEWARATGCNEMIVETQDTNVGACRFYAANGFRLLSADPEGYGKGFGEAKLMWTQKLS